MTGERTDTLDRVKLYPNSHYVTPKPTLAEAAEAIKVELKERLADYRAKGRLLEAERLEQRTAADLEMIAATGSCPGIENYSRYLTGRRPGEPPPTLFEYIPDGALLIVDESHISVPQLGGMYRGDFQRKSTLAEFGFRLPSCVDNRPLEVRGVGPDAAADGVRLGDARPLGAPPDRRRVHRAGDPPDRPDRPRCASCARSRARSTT